MYYPDTLILPLLTEPLDISPLQTQNTNKNSFIHLLINRHFGVPTMCLGYKDLAKTISEIQI